MALVERLEGAQVATRITQHQFAVVEIHLSALYARLLGRYMMRYIPGNPTILPVNMSGGGGIKAAMYVADVAPKDGTILTIVSQGLAADQGLGHFVEGSIAG